MAAAHDHAAHAAHAASFGVAADAYERGRPPYPAGALDWLLPQGAVRVLDLGAGTGKLTADLVARGLDVLAVEPSDQLRHRLEQVVPGARALAGTAEAIPLADASVDVVVVAQAWHWMDPVRAVPEVARVLAPGGRLGLVWNVAQKEGGWAGALEELLRVGTDRPDDGSTDAEDLGVGEPFGPVEHHEVAWTHRTTADQVLDTVASYSYVITLLPARRQTLLDQVRDLLETHPDLAGTDEVVMPYVSHCYRARRT